MIIKVGGGLEPLGPIGVYAYGLTAKNWDQLRNPTLGNRIWATFTFLVINCFGRLFCAPRLLRPGAPAPSCSPVSHATDDYNRQHNNKGRHRIWLSMLAAFRTSVRKQKHANSKLINNKTTYPPLRCTIAMTLCLSAYKSVFYQNVLTVELVCGMDASFGISYTLCKEI